MKGFLKFNSGFMPLLLMVFLFGGCASIKGYTKEDKRQYVLDMQEGVLEDLYQLKPIARSQVENSAGYAVFSNINAHLMFVGSANGYGVVTDNMTGDDTYMKMFGLGGGFGLGIKDFRAVIIFKKAEDMARFIEKGWDFHGQVDAIAQSGEKGASISGAQSVDLDIITYQLTESGIALQVFFQGTKFWKYEALN
jgi:lipid-binding SYLF domain-containing protein